MSLQIAVYNDESVAIKDKDGNIGWAPKGTQIPTPLTPQEIESIATALKAGNFDLSLLRRYPALQPAAVSDNLHQPIEAPAISENLQQQTSESESMPAQSAPTTQKPRRGKLVVRPNTSATKTSQKDEPRDLLQHLPTAFLWILLLLLLIGIGVAIVWNMQPFLAMVRMMSANIESGMLWFVLKNIPIIGGILSGIGESILLITAFVWYAIFQLLELAPTLMTASSKRVLRMINAIASHAGVQVQPGDNHDVAWLKTRYNNRPIASLQFFRTCRIVVLTMEAIICWITHPPVQGSPFDFLLYLATFQLSRINWGNVFLTLSLLFLVEALVKIALHTWSHIEADREIAKAEREKAAHA